MTRTAAFAFAALYLWAGLSFASVTRSLEQAGCPSRAARFNSAASFTLYVATWPLLGLPVNGFLFFGSNLFHKECGPTRGDSQ